MYFTCSPSSIPRDITIHSGWSGLYVICFLQSADVFSEIFHCWKSGIEANNTRFIWSVSARRRDNILEWEESHKWQRSLQDPGPM